MSKKNVELSIVCTSRGLFFPEEKEIAVSSKEEATQRALQEHCYCYRLYETPFVVRNGEKFYGEAKVIDRVIFGKLLTRTEVEDLVENGIEECREVLKNMRERGVEQVVRSRQGKWCGLDNGYRLVEVEID